MSSSSEELLDMNNTQDDREGRTYTANHLTVLLKPVCTAMALAAWCAVHIRTDSYTSAMSNGLSAYTYYDEDDDATGGESSSGSEVFGKALINSLIIICVVIVMTFGIVLLYKYKFYKTLAVGIGFTTIVALGQNFAFMLMIAMDKWNIVVDWITFVFCIFNFAVVGVVAIFYKKGTPTWIGQAYLVAVSVIISYMLAFLPQWTGWVLLVALAFYDLCSVLTPCGPLKWLVTLMQKRPEDPIPGLLYEAQVEEEKTPLKLGLGDFIFYSLLVAKASMMGFTPFATCFLSIVAGLVMTMTLLAVIQAALPALPFSMLLGVACFFFSRYILDPHYLFPLQSYAVYS